MYAAIGGLKSHMSKLNVIGNNIANVNTNGYKAARMTFQESMYTTSRSGSNGGPVAGGNNPSQIGYGCSVGSIDLNMSPSTYAPTGVALDCMLEGEGFFMVGDKTGAIRTNDELSTLKLTRMGDFWMDPEGYVCDRRGNVLYGFASVQNPDYVPNFPKPADLKPDATPEEKAQYEKDMEEYKLKSAKTIISTELVPLRAPLAAAPPTVENGGLIEEVDENGDKTGVTTSRWTVNEPVYPVLGAVTDEGYQSNFSPDKANLYEYPAAGGGAGGGGNAQADPLGTSTSLLPVNAEGVHIQMKNMSVEENGAVVGTGPNGETVIIGYACIANVDSPDGVTHVNGPYYKALGGAGNIRAYALGGVLDGKYLGNQKMGPAVDADGNPLTDADGNPVINTPKALDAIGNDKDNKVKNGGLEASSTDVAEEFSQMITTQRGYQANTRIVTVTDQMLEELVNMKR